MLERTIKTCMYDYNKYIPGKLRTFENMVWEKWLLFIFII